MLSGTLNAEEQRQVGRMMDGPDFRELFNAVLDEQGGELEMAENEQTMASVEEKLQAFHQLVQEEQPAQPVEVPATIIHEVPVIEMSGTVWRRLLPYAAALIVVAGGLLFWLSGANDKPRNVYILNIIIRKRAV